MEKAIYLIQDDGELVEMTEQAYDSEDLLQELLAKYPSVLAGDQLGVAEPRRWLLIAREFPLPSEEGGSGRWSVDHLFLDQDAIPTLIEVKRSTDTRIRREVVGQLLEYAANAVVYWPIETVRAQFEANCRVENRDPENELAEFLGVETDQDQFWTKVKTNLQAGRIRLVFVADEIPAELRRVVEFMGKQMDPADVFAVEIRQYVGQGLKTLVPRVIGQSKSGGTTTEGRQWNESSFFEEIGKRDPSAAEIARKILEWARIKMPRDTWGRGKQSGSFIPMLDHEGTPHALFAIWTNGNVQIYFGYMGARPPFTDEAIRQELLRRLNEIPGVALPSDAVNRYPNISMSTLQHKPALEQFLGALDWAVEQIKGFRS